MDAQDLDRERPNVVPMPFLAAASAASSPALGRFGPLYGSSDAMQEVYQKIDKVAPTDATVLVTGESGGGKELVARTIHERSRRARGPFVAINCGAIPSNLIEAELFGHEKGAFTGATRSRGGCFERAEGGTLLLDEITEMSLDMQVRLLRVLETGRYMRVGGDAELRSDVRIVAATNRDPHQAVRDGRLREDLLYRLAVFPMALPPLRERDGDAELLAEHFLQRLNAEAGTDKRFSRAGDPDDPHASMAGQRARAPQRRAPGVHHGRRRGEHGPGRPRVSAGRRRVPARAHRHVARGNGAPGDLRHARPLRRQQAPRGGNPRRQSQDALQPAVGLSVRAGAQPVLHAISGQV